MYEYTLLCNAVSWADFLCLKDNIRSLSFSRTFHGRDVGTGSYGHFISRATEKYRNHTLLHTIQCLSSRSAQC